MTYFLKNVKSKSNKSITFTLFICRMISNILRNHGMQRNYKKCGYLSIENNADT